VPVIKVEQKVLDLVEASLPSTGTKIDSTHLVRVALKNLSKSLLTQEDYLVLIGQSHTDDSLLSSLEDYKK